MTVRTLVNRAHRYMKTYGAGETPTDDDADVALEELKLYLRQNISKGVFGPLTEVAIEADYEAGENERVVNVSGSAVTVTLPATLEDEDTGEDRAPQDRSVVIVAGGDTSIYDANQGEWVTIEDLTLNSVEPFEGFNLGWPLALQLSETFQLQPGPVLIAKAETTQAALRLKKPIRVTAPLPLTRMLANRFFR
jgi:hypothetical protein